MSIPDYQALMLPLLRFAADGKEHSRREAEPILAAQFRLTDAERAQMLPSGRQEVFVNRLHWARTYLVKAGLFEAPRHGVFRITDRGRSVLKAPPDLITPAFLKQFPEFQEFQKASSGENSPPIVEPPPITPEEALDAAYQERHDALISDLLTQVKQATPGFFERLVVELLVAMGYGGTRQDAGKALGRTGDEGIDGIIKEDRLGLDAIYLQAKRWDRTVGRPEIQQFAGALHGQRAKKGVFITTSGFTREARDYVAKIDTKIVLIDGRELASLMITHNVGVTVERIYEIKRLDTDFFTET